MAEDREPARDASPEGIGAGPATQVAVSGRVMMLVHRTFEASAIAIFAVIVVVAVLQVVNRSFVGASLSWSEELQRYGHIWLVLIAITVAYRRGAHIGVDLLHDYLSPRNTGRIRIAIDAAWVLTGVLIIASTWKLLAIASRQVSPGIGVTMDKVYFGFVIGGAYLALTGIEQLVHRLRKGAGK